MGQKMLLLAQKRAHTFSFYDIRTGVALNHILLPDFPHEFVIDSKSRYTYVGHYGVESSGHEGLGGFSIFVIGLGYRKYISTLSIWPLYHPQALTMDNNGRLYVLSESSSTLLIFDQPYLSNVPERETPLGESKTYIVTLTRDGETIFYPRTLSTMSTRLRPKDFTIPPVTLKLGRQPKGICFSRDERILYVVNRRENSIVAVNVETLKVIYRGRTDLNPARIYRDRQERIYVSSYTEHTISVFSPRLEKIRRIELSNKAIGMSFHPTRDLAFIILEDQRVGMFNLNTCVFEMYFEALLELNASQIKMR